MEWRTECYSFELEIVLLYRTLSDRYTFFLNNQHILNEYALLAGYILLKMSFSLFFVFREMNGMEYKRGLYSSA